MKQRGVGLAAPLTPSLPHPSSHNQVLLVPLPSLTQPGSPRTPPTAERQQCQAGSHFVTNLASWTHYYLATLPAASHHTANMPGTTAHASRASLVCACVYLSVICRNLLRREPRRHDSKQHTMHERKERLLGAIGGLKQQLHLQSQLQLQLHLG